MSLFHSSYQDNHRGGICVSVAAPDHKAVLASIQPVLDAVDVVEIRLDAMQTVDMQTLCSTIPRPLLFTNRPAWEGGVCQGPEEERISTLAEAVRSGAAFVDLELKAGKISHARLLQEMQGNGTRLIVSHHNFDETPGSKQLSAILQQQIDTGAHIGKIVTMAHDHLDVLRVLNLQCEASTQNFPLIAFCMGEAGKLSRIVTLLLGGFMTYAALDENQATAPGQLSVRQLRKSLSGLTATKE